MFTGLVQDLGTVATIEQTDDGVRVSVTTTLTAELGLGDSIAVNGVCLTATEIQGASFSADVMAETLRCSSLGALGAGSVVNLELPLRAADRLGGHVVQGHVDGLATVTAVREDGFARIVTLTTEPQLLRYVVEKGSIAIDGISLTVASIDRDGASFSISLIPETLARTTLGSASIGTTVNIEVDVLAKYVESLVPPR